jgi:A/G-specific adenine glycosylase
MNFGDRIITWYNEYKRELPWRDSPQPYSTWLSEVILQQTRVAQGLPYYERFIAKFPTVTALAKAEEEEVLKLWQGLGYYSRARNMHYTAREVVRLYNGNFPSRYEQLIQLKGIGEYTAAAIASICNNESVAVVDGNVYRVLARHFNIDLPIDSTAGKRYFKSLANELMTQPPSAYNQGMMELGALICTPKKAQCTLCPLKVTCEANAKGDVLMLPVKSKKTKVRQRFFDYFVIIDNHNHILLAKRGKGDIWEGLYEFPLHEQSNDQERIEFPADMQELLSNVDYQIITPPIVTTHILSHQKLNVRFIPTLINTDFSRNKRISSSYTCVASVEILNYPVPQLVHNFLEKHFEKLLTL